MDTLTLSEPKFWFFFSSEEEGLRIGPNENTGESMICGMDLF